MNEKQATNNKLQAILSHLLCPHCGSGLQYEPRQAQCTSCQQAFLMKEGKIYFVDNHDMPQSADWLDNMKRRFKAYPKFYTFLYRTLNPFLFFRKKSDILLRELSPDAVVLNVGSGPYEGPKGSINLDIFPFKKVDIVADFSTLPLGPESVDGIINEETLEHLADTAQFFAEVKRVLKPGGYLYLSVPFICGYHASPDDFRRWTLSGVKDMVKDFEIIDIGVKAGPTSALLWVMQEWLALALSFNIRPLYKFWYLLFLFTTWPLKYLDLVLVHMKDASNIAGDLYVLCRKP